MILHESRENYLENILILQMNNKVVKSIDIANIMGYSKASVSRSIKKLASNHYISIDKDKCITLTPRGLDYAKKIYERHVYFTNLLLSLGVDEKIAHDDACNLEHAISVESFNALKTFIEKYKDNN